MADKMDEGGDGGAADKKFKMGGEEASLSSTVMVAVARSTPFEEEEGGEMGTTAGSSVAVEQAPTLLLDKFLEEVKTLDLEVSKASGAEKAFCSIVEIGGLVPCSQKLKVGEDLRNGKLEGAEGGQKEGELSVGKPAACVFPEEVWRIILGNVSDPKALWNCTNTCQLFETILRPWKMGWMFGQALPNMYRHLPRKKLLECRLVSKGWNAAVDHFLEDHPSLRPHDRDGEHDPRRLDFVCPLKEKRIGIRSCFAFREDGTPRLALMHYWKEDLPNMSGPKWNPFIGRYLILGLNVPVDDDDDDKAEESASYWAGLYEFLQLHGKDILYLHLSICEQCYLLGQKGIEFLTVEVFEYLPNLRKISMASNDYPIYYGDPINDLDIDPGSLPCAPKLETFSWPDYPSYDQVLKALMERHHLQLRKLDLLSGPWEKARLLDWPNLTELHVDFGHNSYAAPSRRGVDLKLLCGVSMPNLSKLILELPRDRVSCGQLLEAINELTSTTCLSTLRIVGPVKQLLVDTATMNFDSANPARPAELKNLELAPWDYDYKYGLHWDFLCRCFPFVENLNVLVCESHGCHISLTDYYPECSIEPRSNFCRYDSFENDDQIIDVNKYVYDGQLYKSNIWELLPHLKVFTIQFDVFTRDDYEKYKDGISHRHGASSALTPT